MFGITVFAASGDYGSSAGIFGPKAHVAFPESDPWVTSVGGTTIGNVAGSSFTEVTWVAAGSGGAEFGTTGGLEYPPTPAASVNSALNLVCAEPSAIHQGQMH